MPDAVAEEKDQKQVAGLVLQRASADLLLLVPFY